MKVNICGMSHEVIEVEDNFDAMLNMGMIEFSNQRIKINKNMSNSMKDEALCHEMVHGILVHIGRQDLSTDETLVQALGNAIWQGFEIRKFEESEE